MSEFRVVLFDTIKDGFSKEDVKANLAKYLKIDSVKAERLLTRPESVIKKSINAEIAAKYKRALDKCGIAYEIQALSVQLQDEKEHLSVSNSENEAAPIKKQEIIKDDKDVIPVKLYTPRQVITGTIFGGPIAATYFIKQNYDAVVDTSLSSKTLMVGVIFSLVLLLVLPFIPEWVPGVVVYMPYLIFVGVFANKHLLSKDIIINSDEYMPQSSIKVLLIALLILAFNIVLIGGYMLALQTAGIITI